MNIFNNLSSLQRKFIRNCFIVLGVIAWLVFGFVSVANEWGLCCVIFSAPFFFLALFIVVIGIYTFIIRLRFKWQIMGVLTKEEYDCIMRDLWVCGWNFGRAYRTEDNLKYLEALDKVEPFWNDRLEW